MATAFGDQAGGHTTRMTYEYHDEEVDNVAGCLECHADIETFDVEGVQTEVAALLEELAALLMEKNILDEDGDPVTRTMSSDEAGNLMNYLLVLEDKSLGVHNAKYVKALLQNSMEALK